MTTTTVPTSGSHFTAGTKTVHKVMGSNNAESFYAWCSVYIKNGKAFRVTEAEVTCKTCAKH